MNSKKLLFALYCFIILVPVYAAGETSKYKTENVIVLIMDGPRYTETWGDSSHQYIPHMANDMAQHGVIY